MQLDLIAPPETLSKDVLKNAYDDDEALRQHKELKALWLGCSKEADYFKRCPKCTDKK